jgi:pyruvate dehydrogenase E1 component alpha subunit
MRASSMARAFSSDSAEFPITPMKGHIIEPPKPVVTSTKDELLSFYKQMSYYRRFEIVCDTLYKAKQIKGFCHLYDGQEAIVIGMEAAIKKTDSVITAYRDHCHQLARGDTGESVFGELLGKETGCSRGKGGSMHMYFPENNFYGGNGIVGAQVPLGAGLAFAHKYRNDGGIAVAAFGDGAANQGQIYEAANMAALWKLPLIFVIENNEYAMGTSTHRGAAETKYYTRGHYIPGIWCDGMCPMSTKRAFEFAADHCRTGKGPMFLEASTYRYHGHSMSDPGISYRSRDEVDQVRRERDCIDGLSKKIIGQGWATAAELKAIDKDVRKQVDKESKAAQLEKELPIAEMFNDIYRGANPPFIRHADHINSQYSQGSINHYTA